MNIPNSGLALLDKFPMNSVWLNPDDNKEYTLQAITQFLNIDSNMFDFETGFWFWNDEVCVPKGQKSGECIRFDAEKVLKTWKRIK